MIINICPCGKETKYKYCSQECYHKYKKPTHNTHNITKETKCLKCGKLILTKQYVLSQMPKLCPECKIDKKCPICGKQMNINRKFCSKECLGKNTKGKSFKERFGPEKTEKILKKISDKCTKFNSSHPGFRTNHAKGKSYEQIYGESAEHQKSLRFVDTRKTGWSVPSNIRKKILELSEYKCCKCNSGSFIELHHKREDLPLNKYNGEDNLIPLCKKCHIKEHKLNTNTSYNSFKGVRAVQDFLIAFNIKPLGMEGTPYRVVKAYAELFEGLYTDPPELMFEDGNYDELLVVKNIDFVSVCAHHLLPFIGTCAVAYLPDNKIIGLSKIARICQYFAKRPQLQEKLGQQITDFIMEKLNPKGVLTIIQSLHQCVSCRGANQKHSSFVTSTMKGVFLTDQSIRMEAMALVNSN